MALSETQRATLRAVCDTFYPALERPDDPTGFWARKASDLGVEAEVERYLEGRVDPVAQPPGTNQHQLHQSQVPAPLHHA